MLNLGKVTEREEGKTAKMLENINIIIPRLCSLETPLANINTSNSLTGGYSLATSAAIVCPLPQPSSSGSSSCVGCCTAVGAESQRQRRSSVALKMLAEAAKAALSMHWVGGFTAVAAAAGLLQCLLLWKLVAIAAAAQGKLLP